MANTKWHWGRWLKKYNFLKEIYERFGTSDIKYAKSRKNYCMGIEPQLIQIYSFKEIQSIANWITKQRSLFKTNYSYDTGTIRMNQDKISLLKEINFPFKQEYKRNNTGRYYEEKDIFCKKSTVSHTTVRRHYKAKYWDYDIKGCQNPKCILHNTKPIWCGERLSIQLDHKDGCPSNNELSNLRFLCANCHSQTETYSANSIVYNKKGKRMKRINRNNYNGKKKVYIIRGNYYIISDKKHTGKNFKRNNRK